MEKDEVISNVYCKGFLAGELSMIKIVESLGLINDQMGQLISVIVTGRHNIKEHFDLDECKKEVKKAMDQLGI